MAYSILYDVITEAESYDRKEEMERLWSAYKAYTDDEDDTEFIDWLEDTLDCLGVGGGNFRTSYVDDITSDSTVMRNIMEHIAEKCEPEAESESEKEEEKEKEDEKEE